MELLALLSNRSNDFIGNIKDVLHNCTVYPLKSPEELEDLFRNIPLNLIIIDEQSYDLSLMTEFLGRLDEGKVIIISRDGHDRPVSSVPARSVYGFVPSGSIKSILPGIVKHALERQNYRNEIELLKKSRENHRNIPPDTGPEAYPLNCEPLPEGKRIQEKVLLNFARILTANFNMEKIFKHFIDSVMEIARVSRMSVMLREKEGFRIKTHYGLDPYIVENHILQFDSELASWLSRTGRIMQKTSRYIDRSSVIINKEMDLLQCTLSFPMIYKGKLTGIFNLDNKVTDEPFYKEELEIIYLLCNYLAAAIKDIDLYYQIWHQKEFTNNVISSMSSGMIAINGQEEITVFNQQASEILGLDSGAVTGTEMSSLPAPIPEILRETMTKGTSFKRKEVLAGPGRLPLGINSYRLLDEEGQPTGAGIIFSDLSELKKLEEKSRRAEKLGAVNDLMAKIAHEVRNPLTSIQTYTQLLDDRINDEELHKFFVATVAESIDRLDSLIDKLITFSTTQDYSLRTVDLKVVVREAADFALRNIPQTHKIIRRLDDRPVYGEGDSKQLVKAIYYIILSIVDMTPEGASITICTDEKDGDFSSLEILISYRGNEFSDEEKDKLLKPLLDIDNLGTELSIPISHKIIEGHRGTFKIESAEGNNKFIIRLPVSSNLDDQVTVERGLGGEGKR